MKRIMLLVALAFFWMQGNAQDDFFPTTSTVPASSIGGSEVQAMSRDGRYFIGTKKYTPPSDGRYVYPPRAPGGSIYAEKDGETYLFLIDDITDIKAFKSTVTRPNMLSVSNTGVMVGVGADSVEYVGDSAFYDSETKKFTNGSFGFCLAGKYREKIAAKMDENGVFTPMTLSNGNTMYYLAMKDKLPEANMISSDGRIVTGYYKRINPDNSYQTQWMPVCWNLENGAFTSDDMIPLPLGSFGNNNQGPVVSAMSDDGSVMIANYTSGSVAFLWKDFELKTPNLAKENYYYLIEELTGYDPVAQDADFTAKPFLGLTLHAVSPDGKYVVGSLKLTYKINYGNVSSPDITRYFVYNTETASVEGDLLDPATLPQHAGTRANTSKPVQLVNITNNKDIFFSYYTQHTSSTSTYLYTTVHMDPATGEFQFIEDYLANIGAEVIPIQGMNPSDRMGYVKSISTDMKTYLGYDPKGKMSWIAKVGTLKSLTPKRNAVDVAIDAPKISISFYEDITTPSIDLTKISIVGENTLTGAEHRLTGINASFDANKDLVITYAEASLMNETEYTITLENGAVAGIPSELSWMFTTVASPGRIPKAELTLKGGATATYEKTVTCGNADTIYMVLRNVGGSKSILKINAAQFTGKAGTSNLTPSDVESNLNIGTIALAYGDSVEFRVIAKSQSSPKTVNAAYELTDEWNNETVARSFKITSVVPEFVEFYPADGATNVDVNTAVYAGLVGTDFVAELDPTYICMRSNYCRVGILLENGDAAFPGEITVARDSNKYVISHPKLEYGTKYKAKIDQGIVTGTGVQMWEFTTISKKDALAPEVGVTAPSAGYKLWNVGTTNPADAAKTIQIKAENIGGEKDGATLELTGIELIEAVAGTWGWEFDEDNTLVDLENKPIFGDDYAVLNLSYHPVGAGEFNDTLVIRTNANEYRIVLKGIAEYDADEFFPEGDLVSADSLGGSGIIAMSRDGKYFVGSVPYTFLRTWDSKEAGGESYLLSIDNLKDVKSFKDTILRPAMVSVSNNGIMVGAGAAELAFVEEDTTYRERIGMVYMNDAFSPVKVVGNATYYEKLNDRLPEMTMVSADGKFAIGYYKRVVVEGSGQTQFVPCYWKLDQANPLDNIYDLPVPTFEGNQANNGGPTVVGMSDDAGVMISSKEGVPVLWKNFQLETFNCTYDDYKYLIAENGHNLETDNVTTQPSFAVTLNAISPNGKYVLGSFTIKYAIAWYNQEIIRYFVYDTEAGAVEDIYALNLPKPAGSDTGKPTIGHINITNAKEVFYSHRSYNPNTPWPYTQFYSTTVFDVEDNTYTKFEDYLASIGGEIMTLDGVEPSGMGYLRSISTDKKTFLGYNPNDNTSWIATVGIQGKFTPANGAEEVSLNQPEISAEFNGDISASTIDNSKISITGVAVDNNDATDTLTNVSASFDANGKLVIVYDETVIESDTKYTVTIADGAVSGIPGALSWSFTTETSERRIPKAELVFKSTGTTSYDGTVTTGLADTAYCVLKNIGGENSILKITAEEFKSIDNFYASDRSSSLDKSLVELAYNETFEFYILLPTSYATSKEGLYKLTTNWEGESVEVSIKIKAEDPSVTATYPANGATGVALNTELYVDYNTEVAAETVGNLCSTHPWWGTNCSGGLTLDGSYVMPVTGALTENNTRYELTHPELEYGKTYRAFLNTVKGGSVEWTFTTLTQAEGVMPEPGITSENETMWNAGHAVTANTVESDVFYFQNIGGDKDGNLLNVTGIEFIEAIEGTWRYEINEDESLVAEFPANLSYGDGTLLAFNLYFTPTVSGEYNDTLIIRNNVEDYRIVLKGTGELVVLETTPAKDAEDADLTADVNILFDADIALAEGGSLDNITITYIGEEEASVAVENVTVKLRGDLLVIRHDAFVNAETYTVTVPENTFKFQENEISWSFTTESILVLNAVEFTPEAGEQQVDVNPVITVLFDASINANDLSGITISDVDGEKVISAVNDNLLLISVIGGLESETTYTVTIPANTLEGQTEEISWSFTTKDGVGISGVEVANTQVYPNPTSGIVNIDVDGPATVRVIGVNGRVLDTFTVNGKTTYEFKGKGVFILSIEREGKVSAHKVVVK